LGDEEEGERLLAKVEQLAAHLQRYNTEKVKWEETQNRNEELAAQLEVAIANAQREIEEKTVEHVVKNTAARKGGKSSREKKSKRRKIEDIPVPTIQKNLVEHVLEKDVPGIPLNGSTSSSQMKPGDFVELKRQKPGSKIQKRLEKIMVHWFSGCDEITTICVKSLPPMAMCDIVTGKGKEFTMLIACDQLVPNIQRNTEKRGMKNERRRLLKYEASSRSSPP